MVPVQQIGVVGEPFDVPFDEVQVQVRVGKDLVEVAHEILFGHHRRCRQTLFAEGVRVDTGQAAPMPRRPLLRRPHQLP